MNQLLPADAGKLHAERCGGFCSYDHRGQLLGWEPPAALAFLRAAIDVEAKDCPSALGMATRFGLTCEAFLRRWTATEAIAKVLDEPILTFLRSAGLANAPSFRWSMSPFGVWLRAIDHPTHWVTVAITLPDP